MEEEQVALLAEQIKHTLDLLRADIGALRMALEHEHEMTAHRLGALEDLSRDHELRLRAATDGVVQFKMWAGLASGGSGLLSLAALVRAFLGG